MTDQQSEPAAEPKARGGRRKGTLNKSTNQKGAGLALVDFFGGNFTRAARASGIPVKTLMNWRREVEEGDSDATEIQAARVEGNESIVTALERCLEAMMAIAIMRAFDAPFKELYYALGILFDKMEKQMIVFNQQRQILIAQQSMLNAGPPAPVEADHLLPAVDPKTQWEAMVEQILTTARERNMPITREQAVENLIRMRPEAKDYLM